MTTCARELVMTGIEEALSDAMAAAYGSDTVLCPDGVTRNVYRCTRDLSQDPLQLPPAELPRLFLWEGLRTVAEVAGAPARFELRVRIIGHARGANAAAVQTALNVLEAVVDGLIYTLSSVNAVPVSVRQDGDSGAFAGDADGILDYPVVISYPNVSL